MTTLRRGESASEPLGKRVISRRCAPARCGTGPSWRRWKPVDQNWTKALPKEAVWSSRVLTKGLD